MSTPCSHATGDLDATVAAIHAQLGFLAAPPTLLTEAEVSQVLRIQRKTLRDWRCAQRPGLPFTRIGRTPMYRPRDVAALILTHLQGSAW